VVLKELSAEQLWVARLKADAKMELMGLGGLGVAQGLLRSRPEAFLSPSILVCEGATEIGVCRGIDLHWTDQGHEGLALLGISLVDGNGQEQWKTASGFIELGFEVALFRDSDKIDSKADAAFVAAGGKVFCWDDKMATEDQIFASIPLASIPQLIEIADKYKTKDLIDPHLGSAGFPKTEWERVRESPLDSDRAKLAAAAKCGWYKRQDIAEEVGRAILGPQLFDLEETLGSTLIDLAMWLMRGAPEPDVNA